MQHRDALVSFDVPRDWDDRTMVAYSAPKTGEAAAQASLVMTRDKLGEGGLEAYLDRQIDALALRLDGFVLRARGPIEVGGRPGTAASFASQTGGTPVEQRLIVVQASGGRVLAFTLTAPRSDQAQLAPLFDRILASVRFAEGA